MNLIFILVCPRENQSGYDPHAGNGLRATSLWWFQACRITGIFHHPQLLVNVFWKFLSRSWSVGKFMTAKASNFKKTQQSSTNDS